MFGQLPGLVGVHILIDAVGQKHDVSEHLAEFSLLKTVGDMGGTLLQVLDQGETFLAQGADFVLKAFADKACTSGGNVDEFSYQVGIHPSNKVLWIEIKVLHLGVELGSNVVTHPFRVHAKRQVLQGVDARAAALAHLLTTDRDKAMNKDVRGCFSVAKVKRCRPKEGVKIGDVFANEVVLFDFLIAHVLLKTSRVAKRQWAPFVKVIFKRRQITDRCIKPNIKIFARCVGYFYPKVRGISTDVPVPKPTLTLLIGNEPFAYLVGHFTLKFSVLRPLLQKRQAPGVREFEKIML